MKRLLSLIAVLWAFGTINAQSSSCFSLYLDSATGSPGDTVCLDVKVKEFQGIIGMQHSFGWDPSQLALLEVSNFNLPNLSAANFNLLPGALDNGQAAISWFDLSDPDGIDLADGSSIYSLCFEVLTTIPGEQLTVSFAEQPTSVEIVDASTNDLLLLGFFNGQITVDGNGSSPEISNGCLSASGCGETKAADLTISGGQAPFTYEWTDEQGNTVANTEDISGIGAGRYTFTVTDADNFSASAVFYLYSEEDPIVESPSITHPSCGNGTNGSIGISINGGSADYTTSWSNGESGLFLADLTAGSYSVTVEDNVSGCTSTKTFELINQSGITAGTSYECTGDSANITAIVWSGGTAPYNFEWSTGEIESDSSLSILENAPDNTDYSVTISSAEGCTEVVQIAAFDCESGQTGEFLVAHNYECMLFTDMPSIADLSVVVWTGGVPPYTFEWSTGDVTTQSDPEIPVSSITVPGDGVYEVTIIDAEGTEYLYGPMVLDCDEDGIELNLNTSYECLSDTTADITANVSGGIAPYIFDWSNGISEMDNSTSTITDNGSGSYTVTVTDSEGNSEVQGPINPDCATAANTVQLIAGDASVQEGESFCVDITVDNFTDIVSFQFSMEWDTASVDFNSVQANSALTGFNSNSFNLTTTSNGYLTVAWFHPMTSQASLPDGTALFSLCFSADNLAGNSELAFTSSPTAIEVTDGQTILSTNTINGNISINPGTGFIIGHSYDCMLFPDMPSTADLSVVVWGGGVPPYTFDWSTGESTSENIPGTPGGTTLSDVDGNGTYYLTITDSEGSTQAYGPIVPDCDGGISSLETTPSVVCLTDSTAEVGVQVSGGVGPYTFDWSTGESTTGGLTSSITVEEDDTYSVTVTDLNGDTSTENIEVSCGLPGNQNFLISHAVECIVFPDSTQANISVVVWSGGEIPYTFEWSTGEVQTISDPDFPTGTITGPGDGTYSVTITDVNGLSQVYGPVSPSCDNQEDAVNLLIEDQQVSEGEAFCLDVSVEGFAGVTSVQFSLAWEAGSLTFDSLQLGNVLPGLNYNNDFNLDNTDDGYLTMSWYHPNLEQIDLVDGSVLFSICFTASTLADTSNVIISSSPTPVEITDGTESLPVNTSNGTIINLGPMVWPGDTDTDDGVDHYDLLNIGLAYGASGPERNNPSLVWEGQPAANWGQSTPESGVDYKHIDTNGDGFIDASDTLALEINWGEESPFNSPEPDPVRNSNTSIFIKPDTLVLGEENVFDIIMGLENAPAEDVYGVAFTVVYDTAAVEANSAFTSFTNCWMGNINQDMLSFHRDRYEEGRIDIAITRTDGLNISGSGAIGQLHITIQDVIFLRGSDYELIFDIENIRLINAQEELLEITPMETTTIIKDGVPDHTSEAISTVPVTAFPNPATERIYLRTDARIEWVELRSITGQLVYRSESTYEVPVNGLSSGTYLLKVWTDQGFSLQRISVIK